MKKKIIFLAVFALICQALFAGYKENISAGNIAYRNGEMEQALKFYKMALEEQPTDQLANFTDLIKKKIDKSKHMEKKSDAGSDKLVLIIMDIALCTISTAAYIDYSISGTAYENLYTSINNTTEENQRILINEKAQVEGKGTFMAITAGVAGAAVLYTLAYIFIFSADNSQSLRAEIKPESEYAGLKVTWMF